MLMANLTTADVSGSADAQLILDGGRKQLPWLKHLFANGLGSPPSLIRRMEQKALHWVVQGWTRLKTPETC